MSALPEPGESVGAAARRRQAPAAILLARVQHSLLPARRMLSRAVLVYEERHFRELAVSSVLAALGTEAAKIRDEVRSLEERIILRADIVMEELWRRTEAVGARQATELQRLTRRVTQLQEEHAEKAPELAHLANQMSEVHRLATEVAEIRRQSGGPPGPVLAELERGLPIPPAQRLEPYLKYFERLAPVLDLTTGSDFARLARAAGIEVSQLPQGSSAADFLAGLAPGSAGAAFCDHLVDGLDDGALTELLRAVGRALEPGGVAIVETQNPASLARRLAAGRNPGTVLRTPESLAALALEAGLEVDECRFGPPPSRHLSGVSPGAADAAVQEVADGINSLVAQLNDLLYGPQDYAVILRAPVNLPLP
ncbi:MAG: hypothetical protein ACRDJU_03725 [Actinomycetota bacterium]